MSESIQLEAIVPDEASGSRLDQVLAQLFPDYSRSRLQQWVKEGGVQVDGKLLRPRDKVRGGEHILVRAEVVEDEAVAPQAIDLDIVYEDDAILVINKPAGLVVHPGAGNREGTLQNALLHHLGELAAIPRGGIVHRLDKDTSGLMVVAKSLKAHKSLVEQLQARTVKRQYWALALGTFTGGGRVDAPIDRHPRDRLRMAVVEGGREAVTHYRIEERFAAHTLLRVSLETGRTHQIRVHMTHIGHPLVGDPVYGGRLQLPKGASERLRAALSGFRRQALHAGRLGLLHPESGEQQEFAADIPADLTALLEVLRTESPPGESR